MQAWLKWYRIYLYSVIKISCIWLEVILNKVDLYNTLHVKSLRNLKSRTPLFKSCIVQGLWHSRYPQLSWCDCFIFQQPLRSDCVKQNYWKNSELQLKIKSLKKYTWLEGSCNMIMIVQYWVRDFMKLLNFVI